MISAPVSQVFVVGEQSILRALRAYNFTKAQLRGELPQEGWDYVTMDSAARRLYIGRGDHIDVTLMRETL